MKGYYKARNKALDLLNEKLSSNFSYHSLHHTLDVLNVTNQYIKRKNIDSYNAKLLRIAVLYHDIGFTISNIDHEELGVSIAEEILRKIRFKPNEINTIKELILATKLPQCPKNRLENIICDADLDYLGRNDFYQISSLLFAELKANNQINEDRSEWNKRQISFLKSHQYHTAFAKKNRQPKKEKRIEELKQSLLKSFPKPSSQKI